MQGNGQTKIFTGLVVKMNRYKKEKKREKENNEGNVMYGRKQTQNNVSFFEQTDFSHLSSVYRGANI